MNYSLLALLLLASPILCLPSVPTSGSPPPPSLNPNSNSPLPKTHFTLPQTMTLYNTMSRFACLNLHKPCTTSTDCANLKFENHIACTSCLPDESGKKFCAPREIPRGEVRMLEEMLKLKGKGGMVPIARREEKKGELKSKETGRGKKPKKGKDPAGDFFKSLGESLGMGM